MDYENPTPIDNIYPIILNNPNSDSINKNSDFGKKVEFLKKNPEPKLSTTDICYYNQRLVKIIQICIHRTSKQTGYCYKIKYDDDNFDVNTNENCYTSENGYIRENSISSPEFEGITYEYVFENNLCISLKEKNESIPESYNKILNCLISYFQ